MASSTAPEQCVLRMMVVGKTGGGKSSSANMILGRHAFSTSDDFSSDTGDCRMDSARRGHLHLQVMDTPGLFDTSKSHEEVGLVIVRCVIDLHPGPHVIFIVFRIGTRYTEEEFAAYRRLKVLFGSKVTQHMIVLLAGGDKLKKSGKTIEQFLQTAPASLRTVFTECGGRCAVLNNELDFEENEAEGQVAALLDKVQALKATNGHAPYECNNYSRLGKTLDDVASLKKEVAAKMREVEAQEAKALRYVQEREAEYRDKLDQLNLTREEYRRRQEQFVKQMEDEYQQRLADWERQKAAEERAMEARRVAQEEDMRRKLDAYRTQLQRNMEELKQQLQEEHRRNTERLQREREESERQMSGENAALEEKIAELETRLREVNDQHQQTRMSEERYNMLMGTLGTVATIVQGIMDNSAKQESNQLALSMLSKMMDLQLGDKLPPKSP